MKEFLEYLDHCESIENSELVELSLKIENHRNQRTLIQDIRTQFLDLGGDKEALAAKHIGRMEKQINRYWWDTLKAELDRRLGPGLALRRSLLESAELGNLYQDTLDEILQLMERIENGEVEL